MKNARAKEDYSQSDPYFEQYRRAKKNFLIVLGLLAIVLATTGFRKPQYTAEGIVKKFNDSLRVSSRVEFFKNIEVDIEGNISISRILFLHKNLGDEVYSLSRLLSEDGKPLAGVLTLQKYGQEPQVFLYHSSTGQVKELVDDEKRANLYNTGWNLEDLLDDENDEWTHKYLGSGMLKGVVCNIIQTHYAEEERQRLSAYEKKVLYFSRDSSVLLKAEFYDTEGQFLKSMRFDKYENPSKEDPSQLRAKRIELFHKEKQTVTLLVTLKSAYNQPLEKDLFTQESLKNWTSEKDREILSSLL